MHFATSAFKTLYTSYLDRFTPAVLAAGRREARVPRSHRLLQRAVHIGSFISQHWIRTCFFFLRPAEVLALGSMVSIADGERVLQR